MVRRRIMAKRIYRSTRNRMLGGVCGGIGEYFDVDPTIVRLVGVVFALFGAGILAYIMAWIIIPGQSLAAGQREPPPTPEERNPNMRRNPSGAVFGILVIILGIGLLLNNYGLFYFKLSLIWPLILIAIGV